MKILHFKLCIHIVTIGSVHSSKMSRVNIVVCGSVWIKLAKSTFCAYQQLMERSKKLAGMIRVKKLYTLHCMYFDSSIVAVFESLLCGGELIILGVDDILHLCDLVHSSQCTHPSV